MNLECRGVSSRSVKLSWKRPFDGNSPMLSYIVQYQPTKFVHAHLSILNSEDHWNSPNTMNITLPNISIGKRYVDSFRICVIFISHKVVSKGQRSHCGHWHFPEDENTILHNRLIAIYLFGRDFNDL